MDGNQGSQCPIIQDLLPIYADGELSAASTRLVEEHLAGCEACRAELAAYQKPLLTPVEPPKAGPGKLAVPRYWRRLRRMAWAGVFLVLLGAGGLAMATYQAGRNVALQDPRFRRAVKENLFTPVHQTQRVGPYEITLERLLLDSARTVVFYHAEPAVRDTERLQLSMKDQEGRTYEIYSNIGYGGKDYVTELEAVDPRSRELTLKFQVADTPAAGNFTVAVDPGAVQASTREWWPGLSRQLGSVRVDLEHVVLGLTQSQVQIRAFWPLDQQIRGLGLGKMPPIGPVMGEDGRAKSGSGGFLNIPPEMALAPDYATLLDETNRRLLDLEGIGFQTDSVSGGLRASFNFQPMAEAVGDLKFSLPRLYLYRLVTPAQEVIVSPPEENAQTLNKTILSGKQEIIILRARRQGRSLEIDYRLPGAEEGGIPGYLPEFALLDGNGMGDDPGHNTFSGVEGTARFFLREEGPWTIKLKSLGELLAGEMVFPLPVPAAHF